MPFAEPFDDFLRTDDFASQVVFGLADGGTLTCNGIYDASFVDAATGDMEIDTDQPVVLIKTTDAQQLARGDTATIAGEDYDVLRIEDDGTGMSVVVLGRP